VKKITKNYGENFLNIKDILTKISPKSNKIEETKIFTYPWLVVCYSIQ